jgi:ribonuclease HII
MALKLRFSTTDTKLEVGVDEAGRGCFWGPLVAGAVIWPYEDDFTEEHRELLPKIKDSKLIRPKPRKLIAEQIQQLAIDSAVGFVSAQEIDTIGMTAANQAAFQRAVAGLNTPVERILIDGILQLGSVVDGAEVETIIDGDALYTSIAAASIVAKVAHDKYIEGWCAGHEMEAERYNLMSCMGYGTLKHRTAIKEYGLLEDHRRLFLKNTLPGFAKPKNSCLIQDD